MLSKAPGCTQRLGTWILSLGAAAAASLNGMATSPLYDTALYQLQLLAAPVAVSPAALYVATPGFIGLLTLALGGVPAALYEGWRGHSQSTPASAAIWRVATLLLALPGLLGAIGFFELE